MQKKTAAAFAALALCLTSCAARENTQISAPSAETLAQVHEFAIGEERDNAFFALKVNEAVRLSSIGEYRAEDGCDILAVSIDTENLTEYDLPMSCYDFDIVWAQGEPQQAFSMGGEDNGYGFEDYPDDAEIPEGGALSGWLYYVVPQECEGLSLRYEELYDDGTAGGVWQVSLGSPEYPEYNAQADESAQTLAWE